MPCSQLVLLRQQSSREEPLIRRPTFGKIVRVDDLESMQ